PARVDTMNGSINWAVASIFHVPTATGNDPLALERTMRVRLLFCNGERWGRYYEIAKLDSPVIDMLNIRYVLSREPLDPVVVEKARFKKVAELPGNIVYENTKVRPRFYLANRIRPLNGI